MAPTAVRRSTPPAAKPEVDFGFTKPSDRELQAVGTVDDNFGSFEEF